jgi:nucleotide-binding universal stress UspA family protein
MNKMRSASRETSSLSMDSASTALGEIVVFFDGSSDSAGIFKFAAELAQLHAARLILVFIQPEPSLTAAQGFARGQGVRDVVDSQQKQLEGLEARHRKSFEDLARRHGIRSEWRSLSHFNTEVGVHAYYADLVVIARPEPAVHTGGPPGLAESLVLSSGRPILLYPPGGTASRIERIVVAWNATRESARAASDAVPLLARAESVEVLVVDDKRHPGHGQEPGADIARHLARHGAHVEVRRASSKGHDVGRFLLSQAAAFRADLLVMGAYGHSQVREWMFGSVTRTVLYEAVVPVLMSR